MTLDDRGRLWVVESQSYPHWLPEGKTGKDRILIFEDRAGKGHFDSCKVFLDNGTNLSGIAVGFGGVWLCATPNLLFIPSNPARTSRPGRAEVVLDGWDLQGQAQCLQQPHLGAGRLALRLQRHPRPSPASASRALPNDERIGHQLRRLALSSDHARRSRRSPGAPPIPGDWTSTSTARCSSPTASSSICFTSFPGAHFVRMYGQDLDPNVYGLMESCADHIHWAGGPWTSSRGGEGRTAKPAAATPMPGRWSTSATTGPTHYRGHIFMGNIHGNRLNQDVLKRPGSGYVGQPRPGLPVRQRPVVPAAWRCMYGPDGGVFVSDWHDTGECHNYRQHPYQRPHLQGDVRQAGGVDVDVAKLRATWNWSSCRRTAMSGSRARPPAVAGAGRDGQTGSTRRPCARKMLDEEKRRRRGSCGPVGPARQRRALREGRLLRLLDDGDESVRGWAVRLLLEDRKASGTRCWKLANMASKDPRRVVRLALASALQRLPRDAAMGHGGRAGEHMARMRKMRIYR